MPKLKVTDIDKQMMLNLRDWYVKQDFMHSTINHRMTIALSIFKWINNNTPYNIPEEVFTFRTNLKEAPHTITFLNYDELQAFYHYQFTNERLSRARDQFCFMAFTSLRISDFKRLMVANIIDQHIEIVAKKTDEHMTIPLVANALEIIEKYKDERPEDGRLFNVISDQKLNTYIKEAAKEAGLNRKVVFTYYKGGTRIEEQKEFWEIISCHDARRTFVSCSLAMGIPENYIRKCSGHKNLRTMAPYMGVGLEAQTTEMAKWNKEPSHTQSNILQAVAGLNEDQLNKVMQLIEMFKAIS